MGLGMGPIVVQDLGEARTRGKASHVVGLGGADMHIVLCSMHCKSGNSRGLDIYSMRARSDS